MQTCGAEILDPGPGEIVRATVKGVTLIATRNGSLQIWPQPLQQLYAFFLDKGLHPKLAAAPVSEAPPETEARRSRVRTLARRDGWHCWYCNHELRPGWHKVPRRARVATVEEICPRQIGGPRHIGNQVLSCGPCNEAAANLPVVLKVMMRERLRSESKPAPDRGPEPALGHTGNGEAFVERTPEED